MASLRRAAERSLRTIGDEEATADRAAEIAQARPLRRMGLAAIDAVTRRKPGCIAAVLAIDRNIPDLEIMDETWQSTIFRLDQETVLKVIEESMNLTRRERRATADQMRAEHASYVDFVGPSVLPHEIDIGPHPFERTRSAIRITQPYREVDFLKLDEEDPANIPGLAERLRGAQANYPRVLEEIGNVVSASRTLYEELRLSTDLIGINNMGIEAVSESFIIVDGQPVTSQHVPVQERMNRCFDHLEVALAIAT